MAPAYFPAGYFGLGDGAAPQAAVQLPLSGAAGLVGPLIGSMPPLTVRGIAARVALEGIAQVCRASVEATAAATQHLESASQAAAVAANLSIVAAQTLEGVRQTAIAKTERSVRSQVRLDGISQAASMCRPERRRTQDNNIILLTLMQ